MERLVSSLAATCARRGAAAARWFEPRASTLAPRCTAAASPQGAGIELRAAEAIAKGEVALRVPLAAWAPLSATFALKRVRERLPGPSAARLESLAASGEPSSRRAGELAALAIHLSLERAARGASGSADSAVFAAGLPDDPSVPLVWPEERLATLRGTAAGRSIGRQRHFVAALHANVLLALDANADTGSGGAKDEAVVSLEDFAWAVGVIESRAVASAGCGPLAMIPIAEYANHSAAPSCELAMGAAGDDGAGEDVEAAGAYDLRALRDIEEGEELTIAYASDGQRSSSRMLRVYGFADAASCQTQDVPALVALQTPQVAPGAGGAAADDGGAAVLTAALHAAAFEPGMEVVEVRREDFAQIEAEQQQGGEGGEGGEDGGEGERPPSMLALQHASSRLMQWSRLLGLTEYEIELLGERFAARKGVGPENSTDAGEFVAAELMTGPVSLPNEVEALRLAAMACAAAGDALGRDDSSVGGGALELWQRSVAVVRGAEAKVLTDAASALSSQAHDLESRYRSGGVGASEQQAQ